MFFILITVSLNSSTVYNLDIKIVSAEVKEVSF